MRMNTYDQLFRTLDSNEKTREINLRDLHEFEGHPFRVVDDEDMEELVQSIRERGILVPVMVRTRSEGGFEIISGHRRCHAARLAGLFKVPVVITELTDEEAVDAMIYTNFQRSTIFPSEKAKAYRLQMETIRHPGVCGPSSPESVGRKYGDNARKVQRYIRLTFLIDELLALVDQEKLCVQAGYSLSFIKPEHQRLVLQVFRETNRLPSGRQAEKIRSSSEDHVLTLEKLRGMMARKENRRRDIVLHRQKLDLLFPQEFSEEEIEELIYVLVKRWHDQEQHEYQANRKADIHDGIAKERRHDG